MTQPVPRLVCGVCNFQQEDKIHDVSADSSYVYRHKFVRKANDVLQELAELRASAPALPSVELLERVAQITAHRGCCGTEHDPQNGKLHGCCVVCGVPWPCEYAGKPPVPSALRSLSSEQAGRTEGFEALLEAIEAFATPEKHLDMSMSERLEKIHALAENPCTSTSPNIKFPDQLLTELRQVTDVIHESKVAIAIADKVLPAQPPAEIEQAKPVVRNSCNRHNDCAAFDAEYKLKHKTDFVPFNQHCTDDECEDCFGC